MNRGRLHLVAPLTALALIAQQVGTNTVRDALLLSAFPVTSVPYFVAAAAVVAFPAAQGSGRLLLRFGPALVAPLLLALSAALFMCEWALLDWPRTVAVLLFGHSSVLGAIAISAYYSLLNERFDPHSAKPLMARVAGAGTLGGLLGGLGAERIAALSSTGSLLLVLCALGSLTVFGALMVGRGSPSPVSGLPKDEPAPNAWTEVRRVPLLRLLAMVTLFGAMLGSLFDYVLKAQAVAMLGRGEALVRFFGLFYAATGLGTFLIQASVGRFVLARLGLGGSVAAHPAIVGAAGMLPFLAPAPWMGFVPRYLDMAVRNSVARAGYELLFTPLPQASKRAAKSLIDVTGDSLGKGAGAALVFVFTRLLPSHALVLVNAAGILASVAEVFVARRLKSNYVSELEGGLRRQGGDVVQLAEQSLSDFTAVRTIAVLDQATLRQALGERVEDAPLTADPVVAAWSNLRSGNRTRIHATLSSLPRDPALIAGLVPLLADRHFLRSVVASLEAFGPRAAGELVAALLDDDTPATVRRRIPLVLKSCNSPLARDGLLLALDVPRFEVRARAAQALLALTETFPALSVSSPAALSAAEAELKRKEDSPRTIRHVFNLLALGLEREPVQIAAHAIDKGDAWARGTSLEYLETVLPPPLFTALEGRLGVASVPSGGPATPQRPAADVRSDLLKAGETLTVSLDEIRGRLNVLNEEDEENAA